jgi:hypothetical protein
MKNFKQYHQENPAIYEAFKLITFNLIEKGRTYYGAKGIIEVIRYNTIVSANGYPLENEFKVNNNFAPDYARLFTKEYPIYSNFFKTRQLKKAR